MKPRQGYADGSTIEGVQPSFFQNIYDILNPSTQTIVERLQAAQQQPPVVEEDLVLQSIYDAINPSKETIVKRLQESQLAEREPIIKTQSYREKQKIREDKERVEKLKSEEDGTKKKQEELTKLNNLGKQATTSEFERYFKEYLPVIQEQLKPDSDASKRAKFLELAKVGLGILSQPGGQTIGEVVGKATTPSIANLQNLMAQDEQALQAPKLLALQAAMKRMEGPTATQLGIEADRIKTVAEQLVGSGISADASYKIAVQLDTLRQKGSPLSGKFNQEIPKTKKDYPKKGTGKHYYYTPSGELKIFDSDTREEFDISEVDIN
jgi:hypothetical protein